MSKTIFKFSMFLFLLLFGLYAFTASATAQRVEPWTNLSGFGGQINDIEIDPCNPLKMFAGSYLGSGLFMTEDGGKQWQAVLTGHEGSGIDTQEIFRNTAVRVVKIASPPHNHVIWVAHSIWVKKSTDGGQTWTHIENETMQRDCLYCEGESDGIRVCESLVIHPSDPQIVYVGTTGPGNDRYSRGAVYKTKDGGSTWAKSTLPLDPDFKRVFAVIDLAIHPDAPDVVWAVTYGSLYRSEDGGDNWSWIRNWIDTLNTCYDIEIKPNDPNELFIASYEGVLKVYYDQNSNEWQSVSIAPAARNVRALAVDPQNPEVLYAAWRNKSDPNYPNHPMIARSTNGGMDWDLYPVDYQFKTLTVHPTNSEVIFGGDFDLGLYKSTDHGQTWTPLNNGIDAVRVYDLAVNPNDRGHILAATSVGIYEKKGVEDWSLISNFEYPAAYSVVFHPTNTQTYYAGIRSQFAKTMDGGANWTLSNKLDATDLSNYVSDIAIHPANTDPRATVIFISVHGNDGRYGEIYKSMDGGDTFVKILEGENKQGEKYNFNTVAIDPSDPNHIFAGGGNFSIPEVDGSLWESFNGGIMWDPNCLQDVVVNSILINPNNPNIIYAGCGPGSGTDIPLYISKNGGKHFEPSFEGMRELLGPLNGVWGDDPNNIFIVGEYGDTVHYDGTLSLMISNTRKTLGDIWGASPDDIFVVGKEGIILHYDGIWSAMYSWTTEDLWGVWGTSPTDVFAIGSNGTILHYDGTWSAANSNTTEDLWGVWGTSPTDVFAIGSNGTILHYDGTWSAANSKTTEDLWGVWGTSPTDVFAVGSNGTILHYDGTWSAMDSNTTVSLSKVWGSSPTDIFAVGSDNMILHYEGNSWIKMDVDITGEDLLDIWGSSGSDVFVTSNKGGIFHYDGSVWDIIERWESAGNSVVDLKFHPQNKNIIYAGTSRTGIYVSPNQGGNWLYLGKPDYLVFAIATSSLYAGTEGGLWQCTGTGIIAGQVIDVIDRSDIHAATLFNDIGVKTISVNGEYMMVTPSGHYQVSAVADNYKNKTVGDVFVYGGDVSWVDIAMQPGISEPHTIEKDVSRFSGGGGECFVTATACKSQN